MEEKNYRILDEAVSATLTYFYSIGKNTKMIVLNGFKWCNLSHRGILHIAFLAGKMFGFKIYVNCSLIDYIQIKLKYKKTSKFYRYYKPHGGIVCDEIIRKIEQVVEKIGVLKDVYEEYYKR